MICMIYQLFSGYTWVKVFSHDVAGRFFPSKHEAKNWNADNPDADLYSILDQVENYRKNGVFHIRLCVPELASKYDFPCNEWTQSSNFVEEIEVTDFEEIELTMKGPSWQSFAGLALAPKRRHTLIASIPGNYWFSIGCQAPYNWGIYGPSGADPYEIHKIELYLAIGKKEKIVPFFLSI